MMGVTIGLLGIIIIIICLVAIVLFLRPIVSKRINLQVNRRIIVGYLAVLIVLSLIGLLLPQGRLIKTESASQYKPQDDGVYVDRVTQAIKKGSYDAPEGMSCTGKSFTPTGEEISLTTYNCPACTVTFVKGVDIPDDGNDKVFVYYYKTDSSQPVAGDELAKIDCKGDTIVVSKKAKRVYSFDDGYGAGQFCHTSIGSSIVVPETTDVIAVVLPRNVKITSTATVT